MNILHDAIHDSSHCQLHLFADESEPVIPDGESLVCASDTGLNIATDWPDDGSGDPAVRLIVSSADGPASFASHPLRPDHHVASVSISLPSGNLTVGDIIMSDTASLTLPPGQYQAEIYLDTIEPFKARHVFVGLVPLA